jgi:hypothetical protein
MRNFSNNFRLTVCRILIIGVVIGLFFSSGEGRQLFPFPTTADTTKENTFEIKNGKSKFYSYSVRNSSSQTIAVKYKGQKNFKQSDCGGIGYAANEYEPPKFIRVVSLQNYSQNIFFNFPLYRAIPSDRAPPIVF